MDVVERIDPTILVAIIGILSVALSAGIGAIASRWHTASKFRDELQKLRLERMNEQRDSYLKNAREQIGTVYVPLSTELALLKASFQNYVYHDKTEEHLTAFITHIDRFILELQALELRGATAYMTTELEDLLIKFVVFLRTSKSSRKPFFDFTYNFSLGLHSLKAQKSGVLKVPSSIVTRPGFSAAISMVGVGAEVRLLDVIQAPIDSVEFQVRFERDVYRLSVLIREVTLGSAARNL